jgi:hypothetical protein
MQSVSSMMKTTNRERINMTLPTTQETHEITTIALHECPAFELSTQEKLSKQLVAHLSMLLKSYGQGSPLAVRIPSAVHMAEFYKTSIPIVLEALDELKRHHYDYMMYCLDTPIILHDPGYHHVAISALHHSEPYRA